mmetsp:Transcript_19318/g.76938  ORF Transcript_19318/g.76938 Transcript_19318/m.76938 type:complete len:240 (+) Transcript_19318:1479-2198(+)
MALQYLAFPKVGLPTRARIYLEPGDLGPRVDAEKDAALDERRGHRAVVARVGRVVGVVAEQPDVALGHHRAGGTPAEEGAAGVARTGDRIARARGDTLAHRLRGVRRRLGDDDVAGPNPAEPRRQPVEQHDVARGVERRQHRRSAAHGDVDDVLVQAVQHGTEADDADHRVGDVGRDGRRRLCCCRGGLRHRLSLGRRSRTTDFWQLFCEGLARPPSSSRGLGRRRLHRPPPSAAAAIR